MNYYFVYGAIVEIGNERVNPFPLRLFLVTLYLTKITEKGPLFSEKENFKIMNI